MQLTLSTLCKDFYRLRTLCLLQSCCKHAAQLRKERVATAQTMQTCRLDQGNGMRMSTTDMCKALTGKQHGLLADQRHGFCPLPPREFCCWRVPQEDAACGRHSDSCAGLHHLCGVQPVKLCMQVAHSDCAAC